MSPVNTRTPALLVFALAPVAQDRVRQTLALEVAEDDRAGFGQRGDLLEAGKRVRLDLGLLGVLLGDASAAARQFDDPRLLVGDRLGGRLQPARLDQPGDISEGGFLGRVGQLDRPGAMGSSPRSSSIW
jgi:hypothetical protein